MSFKSRFLSFLIGLGLTMGVAHAADLFDLSDTWDDDARQWYAIKMNVTDTNSQADSRLLALEVGGTEQMAVRKDGQAFLQGDLQFVESTNDLVLAADDQATAQRTATVPDLGSTDSTFAFLEQAQTWTGAQSFNGNVDLGDAAADTIAANGTFTTDLVLEGTTADGFETTLTVTDPTADRTITFPDASLDATELGLLDTMTAKTGSDANFVTGTAGTNGNIVEWNGDGDAVDSSLATADVVTPTSTDTLTNKTLDADNNTVSNLAHGAEVDNPSSGVHGVTGSVVGTSDTQTLTNKTVSDTLQAAQLTSGENTIADDAVASVSIPNGAGLAKIVVSNGDNDIAEFLVDVGTTAAITESADLNTGFATATGTCGGTTGTDGNLTVCADATNTEVDIENRTGSQLTVRHHLVN